MKKTAKYVCPCCLGLIANNDASGCEYMHTNHTSKLVSRLDGLWAITDSGNPLGLRDEEYVCDGCGADMWADYFQGYPAEVVQL